MTERDGGSKKRREERGSVPIRRVVGDYEIASAKWQGEGDRDREREEDEAAGGGGKTNSPVRENPTWRKRKSGRGRGTRRASEERKRETEGYIKREKEREEASEKEPGTAGRGKITGAFEKVLSCRRASASQTLPNAGTVLLVTVCAASSPTSCELRERTRRSEKIERERGRGEESSGRVPRFPAPVDFRSSPASVYLHVREHPYERNRTVRGESSRRASSAG